MKGTFADPRIGAAVTPLRKGVAGEVPPSPCGLWRDKPPSLQLEQAM
jgi:hypothetical protein